MTPARKSRNRRGYSIIEMIAAVGVLSLILLVATMMVATLLRTHEGTASMIAWQHSWHRLSLQWREDAHRASLVEQPAATAGADGDKSELRMKISADEVVEYHKGEREVQRIVRRGDQAAQFDSFGLPAEHSAQFAIGQRDGRTIARLEIVAAGAEAGQHRVPRTPLSAEACVGLERLDSPELEE